MQQPVTLPQLAQIQRVMSRRARLARVLARIAAKHGLIIDTRASRAKLTSTRK
jgi:hypothetical protein